MYISSQPHNQPCSIAPQISQDPALPLCSAGPFIKKLSAKSPPHARLPPPLPRAYIDRCIIFLLAFPQTELGARVILGDPGADRGGKGKSKRVKENGDKEKHSRAFLCCHFLLPV